MDKEYDVLLSYRFTLFSNLKLKIKCTHYTVHGKSIRLFYNICIMIVNKIHTNHYQSQQLGCFRNYYRSPTHLNFLFSDNLHM